MEKNNEFKKMQLNKDDYKKDKKIVKAIKWVVSAGITVGLVVLGGLATNNKTQNNSNK